MVKLDNALDEALKRIENPTEFSLPEAVIHLIQAQQKHSSQVSEILYWYSHCTGQNYSRSRPDNRSRNRYY